MKIAVVSDDQDLQNLCRACLASLPNSADPEFIFSSSTNSLPNADLYIWDFLPQDGSGPWQSYGSKGPHLILADAEDVSKISPLFAGMTLIVKPVTKNALAGWMGQFLGNNQSPDFVQIEEEQKAQERQWSDFLAKAVHDFRAPLTAASGYCGLLLAGELGTLTEHQNEILSRTQNSLARLARMTSDVLSRAAGIQKSGKQANTPQAASGKVPDGEAVGASTRKPLLEEGEIDALIEQAIDEVQLTATRKNIRIGGNLTPSGRPVYFDSSQLQQVLANLLENACKFTPTGGRIEISGYPYGAKFFRVDVFNTGPAISPGRLAKIFDEYASFGIEGTTESSAGTGLGLAISKRIIEQHEGRIWVENQAEGTCVSFTLPLERSRVSRAG